MHLQELIKEQPLIKAWVEMDGPGFPSRLGGREAQRVLDFGCGTGGYTVPAAKLVGSRGKVFALDNDGDQLWALEEDEVLVYQPATE